jgi:hypothetical protein
MATDGTPETAHEKAMREWVTAEAARQQQMTDEFNRQHEAHMAQLKAAQEELMSKKLGHGTPATPAGPTDGPATLELFDLVRKNPIIVPPVRRYVDGLIAKITTAVKDVLDENAPPEPPPTTDA